MSANAYKSPIEVWLRQRNMEVTCMVVHEDETTEQFVMRSLSIRGAEREAIRRFRQQGYQPVGRWQTAAHSRKGIEVMRRFR